MHLLAIDTSTRRVGVALGTEHGLIGSVTLGGGDPAARVRPRHAEQLAPAIERLTSETGVALADLDGIAVSIGPGAFTGLRVGVTTAKVLAQVLDKPVVPVPSLDLVARPLRYANGREIVAALDARRHEVYWARYRPVPSGVERIGGYELAEPAAVLDAIAAAGLPVLLAGDGALRFREVFVGHDLVEVTSEAHAAPDLAELVELAAERIARGDTVAAEAVVPMYLRGSDAEIVRQERLASVQTERA